MYFILSFQDFISKLPGVTTKNIFSLLRKIKNLKHLISLTKDEINEILGNEKQASQLYSALHQTLKPPELKDQNKGSKYTKKGLKRFRN